MNRLDVIEIIVNIRQDSHSPIHAVSTGLPMMHSFNLENYEINVPQILRNAAPARLYEEALRYESGSAISDVGALVVSSGGKTGRSPADRRIVDHPNSNVNIWWGNVNLKLQDPTFMINRERALDYLNTCERLYVVDGFAGWDPAYRIKVRVVCSRAYHALFMHNMMIRPTPEELDSFGEPNYVVFNSGRFPANRYTSEMTSATSINISFERGEIVILGTEYAGEMKKGIFTVMNYLMPLRDILPMHCSANLGDNGTTSLFFGLSGTGKTTLSADPTRQLIGDDEHCWSEDGVFNIEGGCYAKCINLSLEKEPEIYRAIGFGAVLENVVYDRETQRVDYDDDSITENTRAAYPINGIPNAVIPCVSGHPEHIIFLTCDAFGVLPPVSKLSPAQAMYHFISGYTAKVAGTEMGVTEPEATFSACFGGAFMVWHPGKYAEMLAENIHRHGSHVWLVNTGWSGGGYGKGARMPLMYTRAIINAIHDNVLHDMEYTEDPHFGFQIPNCCPGVPARMMFPRNTWQDPTAYDTAAEHLTRLFKENFRQFQSGLDDEILQAGPKQL